MSTLVRCLVCGTNVEARRTRSTVWPPRVLFDCPTCKRERVGLPVEPVLVISNAGDTPEEVAASGWTRVGPVAEGVVAGIAASDQAAAAGWTSGEVEEVDRAIRAVAERLPEFTADDVWLELGPRFPVTKGLTRRLNAARRAAIIAPTDRVISSQRTGEHGHGQRLGVWRSRVHR